MKSITVAPVESARYRPDIDGIRAIAVLTVVFYHFGVKTFRGGFIGVDVFFVISGFLITRLILDAVNAGTFSFGNFYLRRARRLLPAMLFIILASFLLGALVFTPLHLERLGGSSLHALLSISNFFFWNESGYFDADSAVKPLLHLWSLSVEEQFYFIWPLTLVLLQKIRLARLTTPVFIVILGAASWAFSRWCIPIDPAAAFYLLPSRIVEFCMGAAMVWLVGISVPSWVREMALLAGITLIAYATFVFTKNTSFPGTNALIPCLGTSLAIFGGSSRVLGSLLRSRPLVFTGLISYSLYLCHWPIYVFYCYAVDRTRLDLAEIAGLTVLAFAAATVMYRFIERPFRFSRLKIQPAPSSNRFALTCALFALVLAYTTANAWATGGWYWRFGKGEDVEALFDLDRMRIETIDYQNDHVNDIVFKMPNKRILVVGDSHAADVSNGLHLALAERGYEVRKQGLDDTCLEHINVNGELLDDVPTQGKRDCARRINNYIKSAKAPRADIIIYSADLTPETARFLGKFVKLAKHVSRNNNVQVVVMDRAVSFGNLHKGAIKAYARGLSLEEINAFSRDVDENPYSFDAIQAEFAKDPDLADTIIVSKRHYQCNESSCDFFGEDGTLAIWDYSHWTLNGARLFMTRFVNDYPELFE